MINWYVAEDTKSGQASIIQLRETDIFKAFTNQLTGNEDSLVYKGTNKDCRRYVKRISEETTVFAVFKRDDTGQIFITTENRYSGNWKSVTVETSKYSPYIYIADFATEEEAYNYVENLG